MSELIRLQDPDSSWQNLKALALKAVSSPHTRRAYEYGLNDFRAWHQASGERAPLFSKAAVNSYRSELEGRGLAASSINIRLSAIRKLVREAADNGLADPVLANGVSHVEGIRRHGCRLGNWLSKEQAENLIAVPDATTVTGMRDQALLGVLIGCGLRRSEAANLTMGHIQQREGRWVIVDLVGKHGRVRSVPMPSWAKALIDLWTEAAGISEGRVFRPVNKGGRVTAEKMANPKALWVCVQKYCSIVGVPKLAPHDLRRTYAHLAHLGDAALEQIQLSLGHASIQTTERYLGIKQNLQDAPCDHLGLHVRLPETPAA